MSDNFFTLLGLELTFALDLQQLEQHYFKAQLQFHPDRLVGKTLLEKNQAISRSMDINTAYQTLKSPLKRSQHLLFLQGINPEDAKPDNHLLMEIMEDREALAEAETREAITVLSHNLNEKLATTLRSLEKAFVTSDYLLAAKETIKLSYLVKMEEEMSIKYKRLSSLHSG